MRCLRLDEAVLFGRRRRLLRARRLSQLPDARALQPTLDISVTVSAELPDSKPTDSAHGHSGCARAGCLAEFARLTPSARLLIIRAPARPAGCRARGCERCGHIFSNRSAKTGAAAAQSTGPVGPRRLSPLPMPVPARCGRARGANRSAAAGGTRLSKGVWRGCSVVEYQRDCRICSPAASSRPWTPKRVDQQRGDRGSWCAALGTPALLRLRYSTSAFCHSSFASCRWVATAPCRPHISCAASHSSAIADRAPTGRSRRTLPLRV